MQRVAIAVLLLGCGKQLNPDFCAQHPGDERCTAEMQSIDARVANDVLGDAQSCPMSYTIAVGTSSRYRAVDTAATWQLAAADCADDGATTHLVVISNATERTALATYVDPYRYIGHSDSLVEGTFVAVTDEPDGYPEIAAGTRPPWASGEPAGRGDCAVMAQSPSELYDADCTLEAIYLCECDGFPNDPSNY